MNKSLEELKAIRDGAPDATGQVYNGEYWKQTGDLTFYAWSNVTGIYKWVPDAPSDLHSLRSLSDINRIIELEEWKIQADLNHQNMLNAYLND